MKSWNILMIMIMGIILMLCLFGFTGCRHRSKRIIQKIAPVLKTDDVYDGPEYTVGITTFANNTHPKILGIGESATIVLRKMILHSDLAPVLLSIEEKKQIDKIIGILQSDAFSEEPENAVGVDFMVSGSVISYSDTYNEPDTAKIKNPTRKATIGIDISVVDLVTGKTIITKSENGEHKAESDDDIDSSANSRTAFINGALEDAMSKAFENIITEFKRPFMGKIKYAETEMILFGGGTRSKLYPGTRLAVYRKGTSIINPDTGEIIRKGEEKIGEIIVTGHKNERISEASIAAGTGFRQGDIVKVIKKYEQIK